MTSQSGFEYSPLQPGTRTIRLISVLRGDSIWPVQCAITEADLDRPPPYCALSYVWGNPLSSHRILMDGKELLIPENLYIALQHFPSQQHLQTFWIDALCINQQDDSEKSIQVDMMQYIYSQASEILIWLGPEADESASAMELAVKISGCWPNLGTAIPKIESELGMMSKTDILDILKPNGLQGFSSPITAMKALLTRPWFERVWVIQEAAAQVDNKTVQCGYSRVSWSALTAAARFLTYATSRPDLQDSLLTVNTSGLVSVRSLLNLDQLQKKIQKGHYHTNLLSTLANYRCLKATDPRDKVYALLGLVTDASVGNMNADYTLPATEVFLNVAHICVRQPSSLEFLGYCEPSRRDSTLPSWVPDWVHLSNRHPLAVYSRHRSDLEDPRTKADLVYTASGAQTFQGTINGFPKIQDRKLYVRGFCLATVNTITLPNLMTSDPSPSSNINIKSWEPESSGDTYMLTAETILDAFTRTIVADVKKQGPNRIRGYSVDWGFWRSCNNISRPPGDHKMRTDWGSLLYATVGRSVALSDCGHLCLVPGETKSGDCICFLQGSHVFHILRKKSSEVEYVGECYVHGLMEGQVLEMTADGRYELETFVIN